MEIMYIIKILADIYYTYILSTIAQALIFIIEQLHYVWEASEEIYHYLFNQFLLLKVWLFLVLSYYE